jgi:hypothetical protein
MKKLAIALTAGAMLCVAAVPASAQGIYLGIDDGYRGWGPPYAYSPRFYGPRADVYAYRDRPYYRYPRYWGWDDGYRSYGYRYRGWDDY